VVAHGREAEIDRADDDLRQPLRLAAFVAEELKSDVDASILASRGSNFGEICSIGQRIQTSLNYGPTLI
jgi:hypothetical protein